MDYPLPGFEQKLVEPPALDAAIQRLPRPLVFTNGVFDILHRGHVTYLAQARALGASLVVALNSDASVKTLVKGKDRPINTLQDRMALLAALSCVDLVTWFSDHRPVDIIRRIHPDILVKGADWEGKPIVEADVVKGWGGEVRFIPFLHQQSTTAMLKKIRGS